MEAGAGVVEEVVEEINPDVAQEEPQFKEWATSKEIAPNFQVTYLIAVTTNKPINILPISRELQNILEQSTSRVVTSVRPLRQKENSLFPFHQN